MNIDHIVAISRGGLIPATILSHRLNIKNIDVLQCSSYNEDNTQMDVELIKPPNFNIKSSSIIIDDLADSGNTLRLIRETFKDQELLIATLFVKPQGKDAVDIFALEVDQNSWVVFPWE